MADNVASIIGLIGSGKTTLKEYIDEHSKFRVLEEFIDPRWRDLFYKDRHQFTGYFEDSNLNGRLARQIYSKDHSGTFVFDTDIIFARETYVQNSFDEGYLYDAALKNYDAKLKNALDHDLGRTEEEYKKWGVSLLINLRAPPEICYERQKKRMKIKKEHGEIIPLEYFKRLSTYHDKFISHLPEIYKNWGLPHAPRVLNIDASVDLSENPEYLKDSLKKIKDTFKLIERENKLYGHWR